MSYRIIPIPPFLKQFKKLSKKYPSLKHDIDKLFSSLKENPAQGDALGKNCYKIRLAIDSKGKGKSGGARVIIHVAVTDKYVYALSIYDKSEESTISETQINKLLKLLK